MPQIIQFRGYGDGALVANQDGLFADVKFDGNTIVKVYDQVFNCHPLRNCYCLDDGTTIKTPECYPIRWQLNDDEIVKYCSI